MNKILFWYKAHMSCHILIPRPWICSQMTPVSRQWQVSTQQHVSSCEMKLSVQLDMCGKIVQKKKLPCDILLHMLFRCDLRLISRELAYV